MRNSSTRTAKVAPQTAGGLDRLLRQVQSRGRSVVVERRGAPAAVLLSLRDYARLAAPEPEVLRLIGDEARRNGTSALSSRQIDGIVKRARAQKKR